MGKKKHDSVLDDYEKIKSEILREKVDEIFRKHPKDHIEKMEELGFTYVEDDYDIEEIEERNTRPENNRQRELVAYFENKTQLSEKIFLSFCEEKDDENTNLPLIRGIFRLSRNWQRIFTIIRSLMAMRLIMLSGIFLILGLIKGKSLIPSSQILKRWKKGPWNLLNFSNTMPL